MNDLVRQARRRAGEFAMYFAPNRRSSESEYPTRQLPLGLAKRTGRLTASGTAGKKNGSFDRIGRMMRIGRIAPLGVKARLRGAVISLLFARRVSCAALCIPSGNSQEIPARHDGPVPPHEAIRSNPLNPPHPVKPSVLFAGRAVRS
jgi:hypothetical protein